MAVSIGSLSVATLQVKHLTGLGPLNQAPLKKALCKAGTRGDRTCVRCSTEGVEPAAKEKAGDKSEVRSSWLQTDSVADSFAGWASDSWQSNGDMLTGWLKIGGAVFLGVGFALGARSFYSRREVTKQLAIPLTINEQIISRPISSSSSGTQESLDTDESVTESKEDTQEGQVKQEKSSNLEGNTEKIQQKDILSGQGSLPHEEVEDDSEKEGDFVVSSATAATVIATPCSESLEFKQDFQEHPTTGFLLKDLSQECMQIPFIEPSAELSEKERVIIDERISPPDSSHAIMPAGTEKSSEISIVSESLTSVSSSLVNSEMFVPQEKDQYFLSSMEKVNFEDETFTESHQEPEISDGYLVNSLEKDSFFTKEKEKNLFELPAPTPSLNDASGSEQNLASQSEQSSVMAMESDIEKKHNALDGRNSVVKPIAPSLGSENWQSTSVGIPAPTTPLAAVQATLGRVVVPAPVDHIQEQALAALQALKVIEAGVEPGAICSRREYARWLIAASAALARSPAHKVFPAMYIENVSELAFDDVLPGDPDFPYVQGLAEAGLISSKLTTNDRRTDNGSSQKMQENQETFFLPDSPLSRQDLVSWKLALERLLPPNCNKEELQRISGFIDIDKIHQDAWPAVLADLSSGERSIISLSFGYTRRFQPEKPVTKGQAAIALATGDATELVTEELARLEAESIAEAAVVAELALEAKAQQEVDVAFNDILEQEKGKREAADRLLEMAHIDLEKLKAEREEEKILLLNEQASVESEKKLLLRLRHEVEDQVQTLAITKSEVEFEKERLEKLRIEAEEERDNVVKVRSELEVEKGALTLARLWAEDEANKARAHAKLLEAARKRWEDQGVQVQVGKELDEGNIPGPSWRYSQEFQGQQKSPVNNFVAKSINLRGEVMEAVAKILANLELFVSGLQEKASKSLEQLGKKAEEVKSNATTLAVNTTQAMHQAAVSSAVGVSSGLREGTRRLADECKGGAEKLAQKFKIS